MAEEKETVILDFKIEQGDAIDQLEKTKKSIIGLKEEQAALQKAYKSGSITLDEYSKETVRVEAILKKQTSTYNDVQKSVTGVKSGFDKLIESNKGIGAGIDKLVPGLGGMASGFTTVTATAKAFLATPIGAVIGAVAAGLALVAQYFTRTEAGGDQLARIMAQLSAAFNVVLDRATQLGGALVKLFTGDFTGAVNDAKGAVSGFTDELSREVGVAGQLADILDQLEDKEISYSVAVSETANQVKRLIIEAKNRTISEEQKIALLEKAAKIEFDSNEAGKKIALEKLDVATRQIEQDFNQLGITRQLGESTLDYAKRIIATESIKADRRKEIADQLINLNQIEGQSLNLQEKIANIIDVNNEKLKAKAESLQAVADATERLNSADLDHTKTEIKLVSVQDANAKLTERIGTETERTKVKALTYAQAQKLLTEQQKDQALASQALSQSLGVAASLFQKNTIAYKLIASAQATIDSYRSFTLALATYPPPFGEIAGGISLAAGLASVAKINGVAGFSEGGYTGAGGKYQPAGIVHAGEVVWNQSDVAAVGGPAMANRMRPTYSDGGIVAQGMTARAAAPAGTQSVEVALVYREFREFITAVKYKEQLTTA